MDEIVTLRVRIYSDVKIKTAKWYETMEGVLRDRVEHDYRHGMDEILDITWEMSPSLVQAIDELSAKTAEMERLRKEYGKASQDRDKLWTETFKQWQNALPDRDVESFANEVQRRVRELNDANKPSSGEY